MTTLRSATVPFRRPLHANGEIVQSRLSGIGLLSVEQAKRHYRRWRGAQRTAARLSKLSDDALRDIGVERSEISGISRRLSRRYN